MASIQIKHRYTGAVLFECQLPEEIQELSYGRQLGYAAIEGIRAGANFADAYFARANFADANFAGADFADADFADADFADANFADANFADAYFARANFARANFAGANFAGANFAGADFADAYFAGADFADARNLPALSSASDQPQISKERFEAERKAPRLEREQRRAERYRARNPDVPVIPAIDQQILQAVERGGTLDMSRWHGCGTTHCRAGWAITLAGEAGANLETQYGPAVAGRMIYTASAGYCPHFYADTAFALEDIKARAAEQMAVRS